MTDQAAADYAHAMRTLLGIVATLLLLSACSSAEGGGQREAPPAVSTATTCGQLLDGGEAPLEGVVDLMQATTSAQDDDRARAFADDLEDIGTQAKEETAPHIDVVVTELRKFADAVEGGGAFDTETMVTSLRELNNVCGVTPRF